MSFLTLTNGTSTITVRVKSSNAGQSYDYHGLDRQRMFDGTMREIRRGIFRKWSLTSKYLSSPDYLALVALLTGTAIPLTASGDLTDGADVFVHPVLVSASPTQTATGFVRSVVFELYETLNVETVTVAPWMFLRSGVGYYSDTGKTTAAIGDDALVKVWADARGIGRDAVLRPTYGDDITPLLQLSNTAVRFGDPSRALGGRGGYLIPSLADFTEGEIMLAVRREATPTDLTDSALFQLGAQGNSADYFYKASDGHIWSTFGSQTNYDVGPPGINLTSRFHVIDIVSSADVWRYQLDGETLHEDTTSPAPLFDQETTTLGEDAVGNHFNGWIKHLVIFDAVLSDAERAAWYAFLNGDTDEAPLPP